MIRLAALICVLISANAVFADTFLILPFTNSSKNSNLDWIGESVSESIREALAGEGGIVLDREDRREAYRRLSLRPNVPITKASIVVLAESLDAEQVIFGTYEYSAPAAGAPRGKGTLRITAQILDLKHTKLGPEYMEMGALDDLAKLQTHLAWQTLQFMMPKTSPSEQEFLKRQPVVKLGALENYVRGLVSQAPEQKMKLFTEAVRLDPSYSQANYQLGRLYHDKKQYRLAADYLAKVTKSDDHYREANFYLGLCRYNLGDYAGAQDSFQIVAAAVPLNEVLNNLAAAQSRRNISEAELNFRKALEGDNTDPDYHFNVGFSLYKQARYADAADQFRAVLERDPEDAEAITMLGRCLKRSPMRPSEPGLERLKRTYEETAYRQLKAVLEPKH